MKCFRLLSLIIASIMMLTVFVGCDSKEKTTTTEDVDKHIDHVTNDGSTEIITSDEVDFTVDISNLGEIKDGAAPLNSNIFVLAGKTYTFPIKMSDLFNDGWSLSKGFKYQTEFKANSKTNLVSYSLDHKSGMSIELSQIKNDSSETKNIKDCTLTAFDIYLYDVQTDSDFVIPGGIIPTSTAANVLKIFGEPNTTTEFTGYSYNLEQQLTYAKQNNSNISYSFSFNDDGSLYYISVDYET